MHSSPDAGQSIPTPPNAPQNACPIVASTPCFYTPPPKIQLEAFGPDIVEATWPNGKPPGPNRRWTDGEKRLLSWAYRERSAEQQARWQLTGEQTARKERSAGSTGPGDGTKLMKLCQTAYPQFKRSGAAIKLLPISELFPYGGTGDSNKASERTRVNLIPVEQSTEPNAISDGADLVVQAEKRLAEYEAAQLLQKRLRQSDGFESLQVEMHQQRKKHKADLRRKEFEAIATKKDCLQRFQMLCNKHTAQTAHLQECQKAELASFFTEQSSTELN